MKESEIRERAFAMPFTSPAFPPGPYRFIDREYMILTYRSDPEKLRAIVPEPLELAAPLVKYEFIRMPNSTGFGDYTESGQVIPVSFRGRQGGYTHCMFLNDHPPIAGGRELWGFPKKLAEPKLHAEIDTLVGTLDYGPVRVATGTMGYKHHAADLDAVRAALARPTTSSRSSRTLTAARASASWSSSISRTSPSRAPGPARRRSRSAPTRSPPWRISRCSK
jgi:acetoacetate decarboxylase